MASWKILCPNGSAAAAPCYIAGTSRRWRPCAPLPPPTSVRQATSLYRAPHPGYVLRLFAHADEEPSPHRASGSARRLYRSPRGGTRKTLACNATVRILEPPFPARFAAAFRARGGPVMEAPGDERSEITLQVSWKPKFLNPQGKG